LSHLTIFALVLFATILFSLVAERFVKPAAPALTAHNILLQSLIISVAFILLSLIVQRPFFSGIAILVFQLIVIIVSNTKFYTLKEPMVFSDIAMFSQAFKHPRLYFPFLGWSPVILGPLIIIGLIVLVLSLEPAMPLTWQRMIASLLALGMLLWLIHKQALRLKISLIPEKDNARFGLINSLIAYVLQARTAEHQSTVKNALATSPFKQKIKSSARQQPNITVIQSESFFDARRLHPAIRQDILQHYDQCLGESLAYGKLQVPAWGANTMRSEFSFLTGLPCERLNLYQYYPYQYLANMPLFTLAAALKQAGYYCVCIHPHPASFFGRDKIFPKMGFDEFIDIRQFDENSTFGPYISDQAVTDKILEITRQKTAKPLFIFAITMENHGPLHLENVKPGEYEHYFSVNLKRKMAKPDDLIVYLRHLKNADNMIKTLTREYSSTGKPTQLCFYGDHIPSMPATYASLDYSDSRSDYFIWSSVSSINHGETRQADLDIESLAIQLLSCAN